MPNPCHEDWDSMTPVEQGRHCAVCNTKVMDFTHSTHDEVVDYLQKHDDVCMNVPVALLSPEPKQRNAHGAWRHKAAVTLSSLALGTTLPAMAQDMPQVREQIVVSPAQESVPIVGVIHHGNAADAKDLAANVKVSLEGTPYCTVTNDQGEFTLLVDKHLYRVGAKLLLEQVFVPAKTITVTQINQPLSLQVERNTHMRGRAILNVKGCQNLENLEAN